MLGFFIFAGTIPSSQVYAESAKKAGSQKKEKPEPKKGLLPRTYYMTDLFHDPSDPENIFYLRLMAPGEVTGCFRITKAKHEVQNNGQYINLDVIDQEIYIRRREPRYTNYDCRMKRAAAIIDVQLDRDEMIANGIKKLSLRSKKYGQFNEAEVNISKEKIELTVLTADPTYIDELWFFPDNTIILHAPQGKSGDTKTLTPLREYGISQGFTPMEEALQGYEPPFDAYNYVMFVDNNGAVRNQLKNPRDNLPIGHIKPTRTIHGPNGLYEEPYEIEVFASLPGHEIVKRNSYSKDKDE